VAYYKTQDTGSTLPGGGGEKKRKKKENLLLSVTKDRRN
jgi:hypothetical protein